jgi:hypothetical protein
MNIYIYIDKWIHYTGIEKLSQSMKDMAQRIKDITEAGEIIQESLNNAQVCICIYICIYRYIYIYIYMHV